MPTSVQSQVMSTVHLYSCHVARSANSTSRDLLRRHVLLHKVRDPRTLVSCDACHANKTKCSGRPPCSLCTRRGVNCTFRDRSRRFKGSPTRDGTKPVNPSSCQDGQDEPSSHISSTPSNALTEAFHGAEKGDLSTNLDFFRNLTIVPTQRTPGRDYQPMGAGMEAVYETLIAGYSSLNEVLQESHVLRAWVADSSAAYFKDLHIRWPVLHAPTFDMKQDPLPLTATVCMIGTWLQSPPTSADRLYALRVHEFLVQGFLQDIVRMHWRLRGMYG